MSKSERNEIEILIERKYSIGEMAKTLKRSKSSIWYELQKRHKRRKYESKFANHVSYVRMRRNRAVGRKIALNQELESFIGKHLFDDQSPEEISKRLKRVEKYLPYASASAIRRYIKSPYGQRIEAYRDKVFKKKRHHKNRQNRESKINEEFKKNQVKSTKDGVWAIWREISWHRVKADAGWFWVCATERSG